MKTIIGWDIGGAHLKAALLNAAGDVLEVAQLPCPLWRGLEHLQAAVAQVLEQFGPADRHAVTMTGEMADIFPDRVAGVVRIVQTLQACLGNAPATVFAGQSGLFPLENATIYALDIASANWQAAAQFVAGQVKNGVLVDMGSTTTDVIACHEARPVFEGSNDAERLTTGELVYTGVVRTPVMAVVRKVPFNGRMQRVAAEVFATMSDVYRILGKLDEAHDMAETADGQGKTAQDSARRLARMVGRDYEDAPMLSWKALAHYIATAQLEDCLESLRSRLTRLPEDAPVIGAGAGRFVVRDMAQRLGRPYLDFADFLKGEAAVRQWAAVCAPAFSVAWLAGNHDTATH